MSNDNLHPTDLVVPVGPTDHARGSSSAAVTIVEYGDFECPNCKQAAPAMKLLMDHFSGQVRFVFRHFPLEGVHPHAFQAAEAAECAAAQGRFWEMHDLLFAHQDHLEADYLIGYAEELGLEIGRYSAELFDHTHAARVRADIESGERSRIRGTPGFFVNGAIQDVSFGLRALFNTVEALLRKQ